MKKLLPHYYFEWCCKIAFKGELSSIQMLPDSTYITIRITYFELIKNLFQVDIQINCDINPQNKPEQI